MRTRKEGRKDYAKVFKKYRQTVRQAKGLPDNQGSKDYAFISEFYFTENPVNNKWFLDLWAFAENLSQKVGFPIISAGGQYKKKKDSMDETMLGRRYNEKTKSYLKKIADEGVFSSGGFQGDNRKDLNFCAYMVLASFRYLNVCCRFDRVLAAGLPKTAVEIAKLSVSLANIEYGMMHFMEHVKTPNDFLGGSSHDRLEQKENIDAALWHFHKNKRDILVRNIYLGNLWTRKHVRGDFESSPVMAEVRDVVPPENIVQLDGDRIFFMLPYDTSIPDRIDHRFEEVRNTLKNNLRKYNVLMEHVYEKEAKELKGTNWGRHIMPRNGQQGL